MFNEWGAELWSATSVYVELCKSMYGDQWGPIEDVLIPLSSGL